MAHDKSRVASKGIPVDEVPIDRAFLDIPDEGNPSIEDARKTYWLTMISGAIFVAVIFFFILL